MRVGVGRISYYYGLSPPGSGQGPWTTYYQSNQVPEKIMLSCIIFAILSKAYFNNVLGGRRIPSRAYND